MRLRLSLVLAAALAAQVLGGAVLSRAQEKVPTESDFLFEVVREQSALARAGELTRKQASSKEVRKFAGDLAAGQKSAAEAFLTLTRDNKVDWMTARQQGEAEAAALARLEGVAFDRAYLKLVARSLDHLADLYNRFTGSTASPGVREESKKALPGLRAQVQEALRVQKALEK